MWLKFEPAWNMASLRKVSPNPQPMAPATLSHKHCFISGKLKIFKMQMLLYISIAYKSYSDEYRYTIAKTRTLCFLLEFTRIAAGCVSTVDIMKFYLDRATFL